eukprot:364948-Chlamydomonas_euryale.AAC.8
MTGLSISRRVKVQWPGSAGASLLSCGEPLLGGCGCCGAPRVLCASAVRITCCAPLLYTSPVVRLC